jgi:hypothetical protein
MANALNKQNARVAIRLRGLLGMESPGIEKQLLGHLSLGLTVGLVVPGRQPAGAGDTRAETLLQVTYLLSIASLGFWLELTPFLQSHAIEYLRI